MSVRRRAGSALLALTLSACLGQAPARDSSDWLAHARDEIAAREYEASHNGTGLQAPNRAHGLRTWFEPDGIRVHDRTAEGSPELLALTLAGVGRGGDLAGVAPGEVVSDGARVEIRRPGLVEWFVNAPEGLEQGFTLDERPDGDGELVVELGAEHSRASLSGDRIVFETPTGRRLAYGSLRVLDAAGAELPARFEIAAADRIRIAVDDARASYPIVIDPLLTETADAQLEANQDHANLGNAVASAGDVNGDGYADVIVGAPFYDDGENDEGAAFVFHGVPAGIASGGPLVAAAKITANQALANINAVAGAGDVNGDGYDDVIVGAVGYNAGQGFREGIALVFLGSAAGVGNGTPANADAVLESNQGESWFGQSVAGSDVNRDGYADVIVGAHRWGTEEGAVFVFHGGAGGIPSGNPGTANTSLVSAQASSEFGINVAGAGDVNGDGYADLVVGSGSYDSPTADEGAAFVYLGSASGIASGGPGTAAAVLQSNQGGAQLGLRVASAGDVNGDAYSDVIVGAPFYDAGQSDEGAAFVFHGSASGIVGDNPANAAATLQSDQTSSKFGDSVASAGDVNGDGYSDIAVGAPLYDAPQLDEGAAFVYFGSGSGIASGNPATAAAQLEANQADARLGQESIASAGDVNGDGYADVIVGAPAFDAGNTNEGAAFVYLGGAQGLDDGSPATAAAQLEGNQANRRFGRSVASAGDVNGDGYADVIVGAFGYDAGQSDEGAAFVFLGSASGVADGNPATAATQLESNQADAYLGWSAASAGDVNGDGYGDVIVSATGYDSGEEDEGAAFVFLGSAVGIADGSPTTAAAELESDQEFAYLGSSVAGAGDVNGDGYADVIVGAEHYDAGQNEEGAAFVFLGSASGIADGSPATASAQLESDQQDALLGVVAGAGDVNGDGYADVIVSAYFYDAGQSDEGAAFVFQGSASGIADGNPATAAAQLESNQAGAELGYNHGVAGAGDVNGDGYADVIVGARYYDAGQSDEGAAFVFHGSSFGIPDGNPATAPTQLESNQAVAALGVSVAGAGDVNGDGYADVIVGSSYDAGELDEGGAFVFLGSLSTGIADGNPATAAAQLESNQTVAGFGVSLAGLGDVNGDGYSDVIVGAEGYDAGQADAGAAFVFYGNGDGDGRPVLARQLRGSTGSAPVAPWALAGTTNGTSFRVRVQATHPEGRGRVKLQIRACPPGVAFGNFSCTTHTGASWSDVTASSGGVTLTETVSGLSANTLYRWRARVLHAPFAVTQPGITAPANPGHGPWRRLFGQSVEGDLRTALDTDEDGFPNALDPDDDGDGLSDVAEAGLGTNPLDPDSDDDGLSDGAEVMTYITNPLDPDHDNDGRCDGALTVGGICTGGDNCPAVANVGQQNADSLPAGNACQCGDVTGEGVVNATDLLRAREHAVGRTPSGAFDLARCDVAPGDVCDLADIAVLERYLAAAPAAIADVCDAYLGP